MVVRKLFAILTMGCLCAAPLSFAQDDNGPQFAERFTRQTMHCPEPETLVRKNMMWYKPHSNWKSFTPSFAKEVDHFVQAQWQGVIVGRVLICRYQGPDEGFPIDIQMTTNLIPAPKDENWKGVKKGVRNCTPKGNGVKDCPFEVLIPKKSGDIYESIKYKGGG